MDGLRDMGGRQGFGRVRYTLKAQTFREPWERRVNALYSLAVKLGIFNMDEYRHAIERMEPRHYLWASYYERSLTSLATLCVEKGIVTAEELERRAGGAFRLALPSAGPRQCRRAAGLHSGRPGAGQGRAVPGHDRAPGYIRGKAGIVVGVSPTRCNSMSGCSRATSSRPTDAARPAAYFLVRFHHTGTGPASQPERRSLR